MPLNFEKDKLATCCWTPCGCSEKRAPRSTTWKKFADAVSDTKAKEVKIAIVGKYFDTGDFVLSDAYLSVIEAIKFSAADERP